MLNIDLPLEILIAKLEGRRICPTCNNAYNVVSINSGDYYMPPMLPTKNPCLCDKCNIPLV